MFKFDTVHLIGLTGAGLILFGFYRTSIGKWSNRSVWYELDNLAGASLMAVHELLIGAYIPLVLSAIWVIVAIRGITPFAERYTKKALRHKRRPRRA